MLYLKTSYTGSIKFLWFTVCLFLNVLFGIQCVADESFYYGYRVDHDTIEMDVLGPVAIGQAPWGYSFVLNNWMLIEADPAEDIRNEAGMWTYILNQDAPGVASEISQHGITWKFDAEYPVGQFVNGDWWVVGPVTIVEVTPAPGVAPPGEINNLGTNQWGDTGLQDNSVLRNGSMVVMLPGSAQGYDSRGRTYSASSSVQFPYTLSTKRSLISSISHTTMPNTVMHHSIMWESEKISRNVMKTAAVLTCLNEIPPSDAFRPTYIGGNKKIYRASNLRWDRLLKLPDPIEVSSVQWETYERYFERPWLDHLNGAWQGQWLLPLGNQPSYGRENARISGIASLMLLLDVPDEIKHRLLIRYIQYGIDLRGIAEAGGHWNAGGGHTSGRKWPILFAGMLLGEDSFFDMPATAIFHEDAQTYYGNGWYGQIALWQMVTHHGIRQPYQHKHPSNWDDNWDRTSESYRTCCTIRAWAGEALAAQLMGAKRAWNHDAYFDNVDDWMRVEDIYAVPRTGAARPETEGSAFDAFVTAMWYVHRDSAPEQPYGETHRMWNSSTSSWIANERP